MIYELAFLATMVGPCLAFAAAPDAPAPRPPYLLDIREMLADLRSDLPCAGEVKAALDKGDIDAAGRAYVAWFRKRPVASPLLTDWGAIARDKAFDTAKADGLLAGRLWDGYGVYDVPAAGIDWRQAPLTCLTRFPITRTLLDAAHHTRSPRYARFLVSHYLEYMNAYPMSEFVGKGTFGNRGNAMVSLPWHWSMMPARVQAWADALPELRACDEVGDREILAILHRLYQETIYCKLVMRAWVNKRHNGGKSYILAVAMASKTLGDFKAGDEWSDYAAELLAIHINSAFYPDGQCVEMATSYSGNSAQAMQLLAGTLTERENIKACKPRLRAMVDWSVGLSKPTGSLPSFGDLGARHVSGTIHAPLLDWLDIPYARRIIGAGDGPLPPHTVWPAPGQDAWCGYYAMRSDWTPRARYLCFAAGPWGTSFHEHGDKLSFVVTAFGADLLIDPTSTAYHNNEPDAFISTQAAGFLHNTVTIDGVDEFLNGPREIKEPLKNRWEHGTNYTLVEGTYSFAPVKPVTWTRRLLFADKSYWLLQDVIAGDQKEATVEQNFQFEKDVKVTFDGRRTLAVAPNGARLMLVPMVEGIEPTLAIGDDKPHTTCWPDGQAKPNLATKGDQSRVPHGRGWTGRGGNKLLPAPAVTYSGKVRLPAMLTMAVVPLPPGEDWAAPNIESRNDADAIRWSLPVGSGALHVTTSPAAWSVER